MAWAIDSLISFSLSLSLSLSLLFHSHFFLSLFLAWGFSSYFSLRSSLSFILSLFAAAVVVVVAVVGFSILSVLDAGVSGAEDSGGREHFNRPRDVTWTPWIPLIPRISSKRPFSSRILISSSHFMFFS